VERIRGFFWGRRRPTNGRGGEGTSGALGGGGGREGENGRGRIPCNDRRRGKKRSEPAYTSYTDKKRKTKRNCNEEGGKKRDGNLILSSVGPEGGSKREKKRGKGPGRVVRSAQMWRMVQEELGGGCQGGGEKKKRMSSYICV